MFGRRQWQIIAEALTAPRAALEIATTVGVSPTTVHRVISLYNRKGVAAVETPGKGGRRHQYLTAEQERTFLQPFVARAVQGEVATIAEIHHAFEERVGHKVAASTTYRLLDRQGWKKPGGGAKASSHPSQIPENAPAQETTVALPTRRKPLSLPRTAQRERSSRSHPSDLTDAEWAILDPLIPPAREGGRPRTTEMRDILNAIFSVDRTGCECASVAARFSSVVHGLELLPQVARRRNEGLASLPPCANRSVSSKAVSRRPARRLLTVNP